jgi:hypothetical protein
MKSPFANALEDSISVFNGAQVLFDAHWDELNRLPKPNPICREQTPILYFATKSIKLLVLGNLLG